MRTGLLGLGVLLALAIPAGAALAGLSVNTFSPTGTIEANGEQAHVVVITHGPCTDGQRVRVDVTLTQESTGASGEGHTQVPCTPSAENIPVHVQAKGDKKFAAGTCEPTPASPSCVHATGDAVLTDEGKTVDTFHWFSRTGITLQ